jgi:thiamine biosynthesis lipoprotein
MAQNNEIPDLNTSRTHRPTSQSSRREFITGMGAIKAARDQIQVPAQPDSWNHSAEVDGLWEQYSKSAMACQFEISFNLHQYRQASSATMLAFQLIDDLEDQLTIYRDHSEVSQINQQPAGVWSNVESGLFELLKLAKQLHRDTAGAFDITAGELSRLWGFESRRGKLPSEQEIEEALSNVDSHLLKLNEPNLQASRTKAGVKINLGGIGKGYALDRVARLFEERGIHDFSIHGGQSSVLARGKGSDQTDAGWLVGLSHPSIAGVRLGMVRLKNQALGTSGTARQGFFHHGKRYGHIIDPRTGWPSSHHLSTTVVSGSAAVSDALATAFFVMETGQIEAYCDDHPEIKTILVQGVGKNSGRVKVIALNFEDSELKIAD